MNLPTRAQCYHLLRENKTTEGIIAHTEQVTKITNYLAKKLKESGEKIDSELVDRAALLHDVAKFSSLDSDVSHGKIGAEMLREKGYFEVADIVENHALNRILGGNLKTWEDKVVYYSDKRVNHDKIVSLEERFDYLLERYGNLGAEIKNIILECKPRVFELEKEIFSKIDADITLKTLR